MGTEYFNHRALIRVNADQLAHLFGLPEGLAVTGVFAEPHRLSIGVQVVDLLAGTSHQQLARVEPGTVAPEFPLEGEFVREVFSVLQDDGTSKEYVRFGWEPTT